jgi:hypothetical protein
MPLIARSGTNRRQPHRNFSSAPGAHADPFEMKYVVVAEDRAVIYCRTRAEALHVAHERRGRVYRADWSQVTDV